MNINLNLNSDELKQLIVSMEMDVKQYKKTVEIMDTESDNPDCAILFHEELARRQALLTKLENEWNRYIHSLFERR